MSTSLLAVLLIGAAAYLCLILVLSRWADQRPTADEQHEFQTADGWTISVFRYLPPSEPVVGRPPVILGHGLMMNRASWALSPEGSMIEALRGRGHDVFAVEYRGSRSSRRPADHPAEKHWDYSVDEIAYHDLPAVIDGVCALVGSDRVNWIGHSMGGILIYLYAARFGSRRLGRVVTLGSPVLFAEMLGLAPARLFRALTPWRKVFRARHAFLPVLPLALLLPGLVLRLGANPRNFSVRAGLCLIRGAVEDLSTQLLDWFLNRDPAGETLSMVSSDGPQGDVLASFQAPLLVVAGSKDLLAPPAAVRPAYEHAASGEKRYLLLDGQSGPEGAPPFGHSDMPSSAASVRHLVPVLAEWLEVQTARSGEGDALAVG
jgi:polyhydroxyalkanoate synthase